MKKFRTDLFYLFWNKQIVVISYFVMFCSPQFSLTAAKESQSYNKCFRQNWQRKWK
jgi:capsule polysaccharide export protein KpsE/RkpR